MGKIHDALEKAERERYLINRSLPKSTPKTESGVENIEVQAPTLPKAEKDIIKKKKGYYKDTYALATEQFRILKSKILYVKNGTPPKTILVTSSLPLEGKTTVAVNLAISIAQGVKEHVLLVDCDFRKPEIHKLFNLSPQRGLSDYLLGQVTIPEILLKTKTPKLSVLPSGKQVSNPADLLASERMKELIQELKNRYNDRYIIFDSSPLQLTSETMVLLSQVEGVILVVRAGKTNRNLVLNTIKEIEKEKLLGVVLNGVEKSLTNRYYSHYKYY